ncbi:MAG: thioredoxin domain-containing protein [Pseudomonadota bacterium]
MQRATRRNIFQLTVLFLAVAAFVSYARTPAVSATHNDAEKPELIVATFSSAWCTACKILKPRIAKVMPDFDGAPVQFVELNFTFGERDAVRSIADEHGFTDAFDRYAGATGFALLIDHDTGVIIDTLTTAYSADAMRHAVAAATAIAKITPTE